MSSDGQPCCGCECCENAFQQCCGGKVARAYEDWRYKFWQQDQWSFDYLIYHKHVITMYWILFLLLGAVGVLQLVANPGAVETEHVRYDNIPECDVGSVNADRIEKTCVVPIVLPEDAKAPIFLYYGLSKYFQGSRTYVQSFSPEQLAGEYPLPGSSDGQCFPRETPNPDPPLPPFSVQPDTGLLLPCGVLPWSFFNDTITIFRHENLSEPFIQTTQAGLTQQYEKDLVYNAGPAAGGYTVATNAFITSEDFMVWTRQSVFPNLLKPKFRIEENLAAGTYYVQVVSRYPVAGFGGSKSLYMTSLTFLNSARNGFVGPTYCIFAGLSVVIALWVMFELIAEKRRGRPRHMQIPVAEDDVPPTA